MSMRYGTKPDKPRLDQGTQKGTTMFLFGRGQQQDQIFDESQFLEMRTDIKTKEQALSVYFDALLSESLGSKIAKTSKDIMNRGAISFNRGGRKEGVATLMGPPHYQQGSVIQGFGDVIPPEWQEKKKS